MPEKIPAQRGFTLVEVLVALVIAALALSAIARAAIQSTDTAAVLRDRQLALWVAQNQMAEITLSREWPAVDSTEGTSTMGGREWAWTRTVAATPETWLRRVEINVKEKDTSSGSVHLVGFFRPVGRVK